MRALPPSSTRLLRPRQFGPIPTRASASHPGTGRGTDGSRPGGGELADGQSVLAGIVAGYEFMIRLGLAVITPELASVFRPTGLIGPHPPASPAHGHLGWTRS